MRISLGYPDRAAERDLLAGHDRREMVDALPSLLTAPELQTLQRKVQEVHAARTFAGLCAGPDCRDPLWPVVPDGPEPRAGIAVVRAAKAQALLGGRDYVAQTMSRPSCRKLWPTA